MRRIAADIRNQYILEYSRPGGKGSGFRRIRIDLKGRARGEQGQAPAGLLRRIAPAHGCSGLAGSRALPVAGVGRLPAASLAKPIPALEDRD